MFVYLTSSANTSALCADSWELKEGQRLDGDEKRQIIDVHPGRSIMEQRGGVTEGLQWSVTVVGQM